MKTAPAELSDPRPDSSAGTPTFLGYEFCGHHPDWPFEYYERMIAAIHAARPEVQIKAFTAAEIDYFWRRWKLEPREALTRLKAAGLQSMPGGGAEIFSPRLAKLLKYTGKATTNHTSRAPKRNRRAAERMLIALLLDRMSRNLGLALALPRSFFSRHKLAIHTKARTAAIANTAPVNPINASNAPPRKNPTPFSAFFEPVRIATHL